jgi:protoheme IX farnesyltransferase
MREGLSILMELSKVRIAVLSTLSTITGYILAAGGLSPGAAVPLFGVFLLACGSASINHFQDRDVDARMTRTQNRPVPSGRITPAGALAVGLVLVAAGTVCLMGAPVPGAPVAALLGLVTVAWYNGVYTPLKRVTAFAAIPGGIVGAIPPVIGWVSGGGAVTDPRIMAVAFFFFVWQVPHFWLLLLRIGGDYERAGLPSLTAVFSRRQLTRITFVWMVATAVACLMIPMFGLDAPGWILAGFVAASVWLAWNAVVMLRTDGTMLAFREINVYALMVISLLSLSGFLG